MAHRVETMAYVNETPWHGLGVKIDGKTTPAQMMKAAGCNWTVSKERLKTFSGNEVPGKFALVRDTDQTVLDIVGSAYKPTQNAEIFKFFHRFVEAGKMQMDTAGSLCNGRFIWALASMQKGFRLAGGDEVRGNLLLMQPHELGKALIAAFTPVRVVCWNTLTMALGQTLSGKRSLGTGTFRMSHMRVFDDKVREEAEETLGLASKQLDEFKQAGSFLATKNVKNDKALTDYFVAVFGKQGDGAKAEEPKNIAFAREAFHSGPGAELKSARGTWWGAFNSITYVLDHQLGNDQNVRLREAWVGRRASTKRKALAEAVRFSVGSPTPVDYEKVLMN